MKTPLLLLSFIGLFISSVDAQPGRGYARRAVQKNIEKKMDSTYGNQGRKALRDITYENDKRYNDPVNRVQATIVFLDSSFKKDRVKSVMSSAMVFGKNGEAYITRDELKPNQPDMQWFVFNYADKANYIVMPKDKTAMKMPLISFQKMAEKASQRAAAEYETGNGGSLVATDDYATFHGHKARKFVLTQENGVVMEQWVSKGLKLDLGDNYVMGARLNAYRFSSNPEYQDLASGFVVRMVQYDKDGKVKYTRTLSKFEQGRSDEKYFDLSGYKVTDVLSGLYGQ